MRELAERDRWRLGIRVESRGVLVRGSGFCDSTELLGFAREEHFGVVGQGAIVAHRLQRPLQFRDGFLVMASLPENVSQSEASFGVWRGNGQRAAKKSLRQRKLFIRPLDSKADAERQVG